MDRRTIKQRGVEIGQKIHRDTMRGKTKLPPVAPMPKDNEAPIEVTQGDRDAAADFVRAWDEKYGGGQNDFGPSEVDSVWLRSGDHDKELIVQQFARHRLAYQSEAPAQGEGLCAADAFEMGFSWRGTLTGQTLEDSRAVGRTLGCDLFEPIADAINQAEKDLGFNPFQSADLGICQAKAIIKAALATISKTETVGLPLADRKAIARGLCNAAQAVIDNAVRSYRSRGKERYIEDESGELMMLVPHEDWYRLEHSLAAILALSDSLLPSSVGEGKDWLSDIEIRASNAEALWKEAGSPGPDKCDRVPGSMQYGAMMAFQRLAKDMRSTSPDTPPTPAPVRGE